MGLDGDPVRQSRNSVKNLIAFANSLRMMALRAQRVVSVFASRVAGGRAAVAARGYHEVVIDHYENPRNVGSLDKSKPNVGTGMHFYFIQKRLVSYWLF